MAESPFVDDSGFGWDPEAAAARAGEVAGEQYADEREAAAGPLFELPEIPEDKVRSVLFVGGDGLHAIAGVGEYDWVMTQRDLERIAPPLTRILNRYDAAKVAAGYSDELSVVVGFGLYGWRSMLERVAVLRAQEAGAPTQREAAPSRPAPAPAPPPAPPAQTPAPAWPEDVPREPRAAAPEPPLSPGSGADHFPGAGAPRDPAAAAVEVVSGYVTQAERIRQARERSPDAVPAEAPPAPR